MKEEKDIRHLLSRLSKDDADAFRGIFHLFSRKVYSFALRLTHSAVTAEEMVQEVFMRLWTGRATANNIEDIDAYLFIVTRNLVLNTLRRHLAEEKALKVVARKQPQHHKETEESLIYDEYQRMVNETISHLPSQQRVVYSLCQQEGLRYEEVAQRLKISRLTVKTHMQQALKAIRSRVSEIVQLIVVGAICL